MAPNALKDHLLKCYELCNCLTGPPASILNPLKSNVLILCDLEIDSQDIPALCRFLNSKQAYFHLEAIILNKTSTRSIRGVKSIAAKMKKYSAFDHEGSRLMNAVFGFIGKSRNLHTIILESMHVSLQLLPLLASSLCNIKHDMKSIIFKDFPLGDDGLQVLAHALQTCRYQYLSLEACNLTDICIPSLIGIIKAQEAIQDASYWNSNLRNYRLLDSSAMFGDDDKRQHQSSVTPGLIALNLSRNAFTKRLVDILCTEMAHNEWVLGMNLCYNNINSDGIELLLSSFVTNNEKSSTMLALPLRGNPGVSEEDFEFLCHLATQNEGNDVYYSLPLHVVQQLLNWLRMQRDPSPPFPLKKKYTSAGVFKDSRAKDVDRNMSGNKKIKKKQPTSPFSSKTKRLYSDNFIATSGKSLQTSRKSLVNDLNPNAVDNGDGVDVDALTDSDGKVRRKSVAKDILEQYMTSMHPISKGNYVGPHVAIQSNLYEENSDIDQKYQKEVVRDSIDEDGDDDDLIMLNQIRDLNEYEEDYLREFNFQNQAKEKTLQDSMINGRPPSRDTIRPRVREQEIKPLYSSYDDFHISHHQRSSDGLKSSTKNRLTKSMDNINSNNNSYSYHEAATSRPSRSPLATRMKNRRRKVSNSIDRVKGVRRIQHGDDLEIDERDLMLSHNQRRRAYSSSPTATRRKRIYHYEKPTIASSVQHLSSLSLKTSWNAHEGKDSTHKHSTLHRSRSAEKQRPNDAHVKSNVRSKRSISRKRAFRSGDREPLMVNKEGAKDENMLHYLSSSVNTIQNELSQVSQQLKSLSDSMLVNQSQLSALSFHREKVEEGGELDYSIDVKYNDDSYMSQYSQQQQQKQQQNHHIASPGIKDSSSTSPLRNNRIEVSLPSPVQLHSNRPPSDRRNKSIDVTKNEKLTNNSMPLDDQEDVINSMIQTSLRTKILSIINHAAEGFVPKSSTK